MAHGYPQSLEQSLCQKVLNVAMNVITARNVQDVVNVLKREVQKTIESGSNADDAKGPHYRNRLIKAIHGCSVRFPAVAESVVHTLMDFLGTESGMQVIIFVRAVVEHYPRPWGTSPDQVALIRG